ncbi:MAG: hypothetical protein JSU85_00720 [Candidatus Zixiibacteriota bacterium]|nr:MAG: hypothetical protein JSU85_00720 [candidate division Zixibacteria bacterium]
MKKRIFFLFLIVLGIALVFSACSDNATESELTEGDYDDLNYETARATADSIVVAFFQEADEASDFIGFDGSAPMSPAAESLLITFDELSCWWHIYVGADTTNGSLIFVDSVKFQDAEGCQMFPDSLTTTSIEYRAYLDINVVSDTGSLVATANENLLLEGIQEDTCVINATAESNAEVALGLYEAAYDYSGALDDIKFLTEELMYEEEPRPVSGTLALNLTIYGSSQQGSITFNWSIIITFNETGYHARAESGENYWEWDVTYIA